MLFRSTSYSKTAPETPPETPPETLQRHLGDTPETPPAPSLSPTVQSTGRTVLTLTVLTLTVLTRNTHSTDTHHYHYHYHSTLTNPPYSTAPPEPSPHLTSLPCLPSLRPCVPTSHPYLPKLRSPTPTSRADPIHHPHLHPPPPSPQHNTLQILTQHTQTYPTTLSPST